MTKTYSYTMSNNGLKLEYTIRTCDNMAFAERADGTEIGHAIKRNGQITFIARNGYPNRDGSYYYKTSRHGLPGDVARQLEEALAEA